MLSYPPRADPAATAANIAGPEGRRLTGLGDPAPACPVMSAVRCMRSRFWNGRPPQATISSTGIPASSSDSMMTLVPNTVASSSAR